MTISAKSSASMKLQMGKSLSSPNPPIKRTGIRALRGFRPLISNR